MSRLKMRLTDLEQRLSPAQPSVWVRIFRYEDQTEEQAIAAWEAEHGPVDDRNIIMRVIINKPCPSRGRATGALCPI